MMWVLDGSLVVFVMFGSIEVLGIILVVILVILLKE